ncbi:MAG: cytochrome c oxidase subunit 3 [Candidatus Cloacimonetes bacterium]|nr:cytochrome c oxidase subunit 3 [Candidatus Cloacimonadota bacterium]
MWIFIFAELVTFALFFGVFAWFERGDPAGFAAGRADLHATTGLINTLVLLTGGATALAGVRSLERTGDGLQAGRWFLAAVFAGLVFSLIKLSEFAGLFAQGRHLSSSSFHFFYFFLCFIHLAHVWLGMALLLLARRHKASGTSARERLSSWQAAASYWHMVDLVWLVLFPLVYLGGGQ